MQTHRDFMEIFRHGSAGTGGEAKLSACIYLGKVFLLIHRREEYGFAPGGGKYSQ